MEAIKKWYQRFLPTGAQPEISQGRGGFMKLGHSDKHFVKNSRKKGPVGKNVEVFFLWYS